MKEIVQIFEVPLLHKVRKFSMTRGCIKIGSCISICFRVEDVKTEQDHSILTSQSTLFLCWIQTRYDRRTIAQLFWAHFYYSR
jgi:hypothetical protein